jgi:ABC-type multidrug transport system permease subunit
MLDRPIVNRHRAYGFHRPSALWIAHVLVDTAFASLRVLVFSILVYFLCGLVREAGAFLTFYLVMITGYMAMTLIFRTLYVPRSSALWEIIACGAD